MTLRLTLSLTFLAACTAGTDGPATDTDTTGTEDPYADVPPPAEPKAYSGTACPDMVGNVSGFTSGSKTNRAFRLNLPRKTEGVGVLFLWHGNGDTAQNFDFYMDAEQLAKDLKVITVVPESGAGGLGLDWSVPPNAPAADAALFDDILACLSEQYDLDLRRVYSAGFSAGALWTSWLLTHRSEHLAAAVTFSGGSDGLGGVNPYATPDWNIPVLMTEGGATDQVFVNFQAMTNSMSGKLRDDGSTVVVCSHSQGHTPPSGFQTWAWDFLDAHVFGVEPSPYADGEDPSGNLPNGCKWD